MPENARVITMGNGANEKLDGLSSQLHFSFLKTLSHKSCRNQLPMFLWSKSVICATNEMDSHTICNGDSGSPLVTTDGTLMGISRFIRPGNE